MLDGIDYGWDDDDSAVDRDLSPCCRQRARVIRDELLSCAENQWKQSLVGGLIAPVLVRGDLAIVMWNSAHLEVLEADLQLRPSSASKRGRAKWPPYALDVWVKDERVLSISWRTDDDLKVTAMTRGHWESIYFPLGISSECPMPTLH